MRRQLRLLNAPRSQTTLRAAIENNGRVNNFDLLRLIAATMVLVSHSFPLTGRREGGFPGTTDTLGFVGVLIFFSISGFLIAQSWATDPRPWEFMLKRARRILPALAVSLLVTSYVIGAVVTTLPLTEYLASPIPFKFVVLNLAQLTNYELPGVFLSNHSHGANGSLGTLPVEVKAYVAVLVIGMTLASRRPLGRLAWCALLIPVALASYGTGVKPPHTLTQLFVLFAGAATYYLLRRRVVLSPWILALAILAWQLSYGLPFYGHILIQAVAFPYIVLFLAYRWLSPLRHLVRPGDVSYGIFIWAFPVQQTIIHLVPLISPWQLIGLALPTTYGIALLSWHVIERPALRWRRGVPLVEPRNPR